MATQTLPAASEVELEPLRPPLKWAGGKRWLVPYLRKLWQPYRDRRLVEPLCGGLAVALGLRPHRALLNDLNPHNINFYRQLGEGLELDIEMRNDRDLYYAHRARFNALIAAGEADTPEAAQLFYFLNHTGYNGLCRFNRRGEFNVPFGRHERINYARNLSVYAGAMQGWRFSTGDFAALALEPGDFIYADPPYDVEFTQYSKEAFGWDEQERLAEWLAAHDGPVVLSNQATDRVKKLYRKLGFKLQLKEAPRMISCNGDRTKATEVIATRGL
ncbi:MAG TPA: Dam family site-specific DNA-(adenine-N6)-methyltransferase [Dehalococcoidia bacterium]|jgi:DNA adenine methylase|nr:Dam family site-specific DNA-(adenine-N6)-methyltransferase [Dehalococcoidia bacterium]